MHPAALLAFPAAEVAWMALSPVAVGCVAGGAAATVRRLAPSPRVLWFWACLGTSACVAMSVFLAACCVWIGDGAGPGSPFHAGTIDVGGVAVMTAALAVITAALAVAARAAAQARRPAVR